MNRVCLSLVVLLSFGGSFVRAEDDSYTSYDSIVSELKADAEDSPAEPKENLSWENVAYAAGMSLATSYVNVSAPNGGNGSGLLKGFEIHGGMNLGTKNARGEVAFRNFTPESLGGTVSADLTEFEGRLMFLPELRDQITMRMGFGLGMRSMEIRSRGAAGWETFSASSAASGLILGMEKRLSGAVTIGPDLAYRSRLAIGTFDKSSWDAVIRLNAIF
ncbi:MAG TPA: hypothetical protein PKC28_12125 [Bdellovibrionales bacterium]|nr:hypothetical protein [Bdellovibrionales bacterium]